MNALELLHTRVSAPRLGGDPPEGEELHNIFKAALRAPDHGLLRPWRFLVIKGDARHKLGTLFADTVKLDQPDLSDRMIEKARAKPLRAPLIIVGIASIQASAKIPEIEQLLSAGAALQNMMLAAYAQGIGAMWRTGAMAYHQEVAKGLGLAANETIVGFLYLGKVEGRVKLIPEFEVEKYFREWSC